MSTLDRERHLRSFASTPIQKAITPWRITIAPFTSVTSRHHWIAAALDDGLRLAVIVEKVKVGWIVRRRAKFVGTRIIIIHDGR
jgi:hypothetical protein